MPSESRWYQDIARQVGTYRDTLDKKTAGRLKLDLLLRVAGRVDQFSGTCGQCQLYRQEVERLVGEMGNLAQLPGREALHQYRKALDVIVKHLTREHKLVRKGQNMALWIGIGVALGSGLSAALDNPGLSGMGIALGLAIGAYLDKKAEKEGRVL
ncbi:MAG: hypothetical protein ABID87_09645 [Chloroflexota bacterium]